VADMERRKFCRACGSQIPEDSMYCPICGSDLKPKPETPEVKKEDFGRLQFAVTRPRMTRVIIFAFCIAVFTMGIIVGNNTPMNDEKANEILEPFLDFEPSFTNIAFNNIVNNLLIFTPGLGVLLLAYSSYNAGLVLAAVSFQTGLSDLSYFMMLLYNPVFWIEVIVFCLAATQGVMFLLGWLTRRRNIEGRNTLIVMVICFLLLIVAAYIEVAFYT
jgi:hypothetical protein